MDKHTRIQQPLVFEDFEDQDMKFKSEGVKQSVCFQYIYFGVLKDQPM